MLQNQLNEGRFCPDCGIDLSVICPTCHGLGYVQPLPSISGFIITNCLHENEYGEYCSKCGARLFQDTLTKTCGTCMGKGWVLSQNHYCFKKVYIPPRP